MRAKVAPPVALVALAAAVVAAGTLAATSTPQQLLRYLPPDAEVVVGMDVGALRAHPLVQSWLLQHQAAWSGSSSEAQEFLREAGLDPFRDVDFMLVAMVPRPQGDRGIAVFGGRFDPPTLGAALLRHGGSPVPIGNRTAYELPDRGRHGAARPVLLFTEDLALAGDAETVRLVFAGSGGGSSLVAESIRTERIDTGSVFWMVAAVPRQVREHLSAGASAVHATDPAVAAVTVASRAVRQIALHAELGTELGLAGVAVADTEENAELLRDAIKGAVAAARLHAQDRVPELVDVLRAVVVRAEGTEVSGRARIPVALIEKLARDRHDRPAEATK